MKKPDSCLIYIPMQEDKVECDWEHQLKLSWNEINSGNSHGAYLTLETKS